MITGDLIMLGASMFGVGKKAELALRAGNHLLIIARSPEKQDEAFRYLVNLANSDTDFVKLVDQRYESVVNFKSKHIDKTNFSEIKTQDQIEKADFIEKQFEDVLKEMTFSKPHSPTCYRPAAGAHSQATEH